MKDTSIKSVPAHLEAKHDSYQCKTIAFGFLSVLLIIVWTLFWSSESSRKLVLVFGTVVTIPVVTLLVLYVVLHSKCIALNKNHKIAIFSSILMYLCVVFTFLIPPFAVPDEYHHYLSSYWLSNCIMGKSTLDSPATINMRKDDWDLYTGFGSRHEMKDFQTYNITDASYQEVADHFSLMLRSDSVYSVPEELMFDFSFWNENSFAKLGSVAGILIGRLFNLGAFPLFYLGRLFSALFFVLLVSTAIYLTPIGRGAFIGISLLPMTLNLAASYSYDGGIIGFSLLFQALAFRVFFKSATPSLLVGLTALSILIAPCKVIYILELLLVLFIPNSRFTTRKLAVIYKLVTLASSLGIAFLLKLSMIHSVAVGTTLSMHQGGGTFSLSALLSNPFDTIELIIRTLDSKLDFYLFSALGGILGWFQPDTASPNAFMILYLISLLYLVQTNEESHIRLTLPWKLLFFGIATSVVLATMLSMAMAWTSSTSTVIEGVQGRYFLPVLPLLLLSLSTKSISILGDSLSRGFSFLVLLNALYVIRFIGVALI